MDLRRKRRRDGQQYAIDAALNRAVEIACTHSRHNCIANDFTRAGIGQRTFQTISHFNAHFAVAHKEKQDRAVVDAWTSNLPLLGSMNRPILERRIAGGLTDPNNDGCVVRS